MKKIAIIKLGALGDVVRTLSILPALKKEYPDAHITWITKKSSEEIVSSSHYVDKTIILPLTEQLSSFDLLYNFDIEEEATELAKSLKSEKKLGFSSEEGFPSAFNLPAEYYLNTLFDDELKKTNKKTYQEMMFEAAELEYKKQHHPIYLSEENNQHANNFVKNNNISQNQLKNLIGIHIGSSKRWPSKAWSKEKIIELIEKSSKKGFFFILFAGHEDIDKQEEIYNLLTKKKIQIFKNNPHNSIMEFATLLNLCKKVVCFDSLALHISLALKKQTITLFFCTSPNEVEDYGILKKVCSPMLNDFFPEKMDQYSEELVNSISTDEVLRFL